MPRRVVQKVSGQRTESKLAVRAVWKSEYIHGNQGNGPGGKDMLQGMAADRMAKQGPELVIVMLGHFGQTIKNEKSAKGAPAKSGARGE